MVKKTAYKVLVAEDERALTKAYEAKLKSAGFTVILAADGNEAIEKAKSEKPDIMLLDLMMPEKNGFEVLEALHADKDWNKAPIIILSNLSQEIDMKRSKELGAVGYFVKSDHTLQDIVDAVNETLAKSS